MRKTKLYWTQFASVILFICLLSISLVYAQDVNGDPKEECTVKGTVLTLSDSIHCGTIIKTDEGKMLQIFAMESNILLYDGMRIIFGYEEIHTVDTKCGIGQPVIIGCIEEIGFEKCFANFQYELVRCGPEYYGRCGERTVHFVNLSNGDIDSVFWNFGDGNYSTELNPVHNFDSNGVYEVFLTITTKGGCISEYYQNVRVGLSEDCQADFSYYPLYLEYDKPDSLDDFMIFDISGYQFFDESYGDVIRRTWIFGTDTLFDEKEPVFFFEKPGKYLIELRIETADSCTSSVQKVVYVGPYSECDIRFEYYPFNYVMSTIWPGGYGYSFIDVTKGDVIDRQWIINGDTILSDSIVMYEFSEPGEYWVCLTSETVQGCRDTYCETIYVGVEEKCKASFNYWPISDSSWIDHRRDYFVYTYQFVDNSSRNVIGWYWEFGDGEISHEQNPMHTYKEAGSYKVCLVIATSDGCEDQICMEVFVDPISECKAFYKYCNYHVPGVDSLSLPDSLAWYIGFKNYSTEGASYEWSFGDGGYSKSKNPVHKYAQAGYYNVCLTIWTADGCSDVYCSRVKVGDVSCMLDFSTTLIEPDCGGYNPAYLFNAFAKDYITSYYWDFGDGEYSYDANPMHIYQESGSYEVVFEAVLENNCVAIASKTIWVDYQVIDSAYTEKCGTSFIKNIKGSSSLIVDNVFPNPAKTELNINVTSNLDQEVSISLINMLGQQTKLSAGNFVITGENLIQLNLEGLENGSYIYLVTSADGLFRGNIIIAN